jgi:drug/metabolite transporter (DMT)-like permease
MTESQKGNTFIILQGFIWSFFPIITILGLKGVPSIIGLFWATIFSAIFFFVTMVFRNKLKELKNFQVWKYSFNVAFFIGVIFYGLFFYGLTKTIATNGAIVALFEVATSFLFFHIIRKENISKKHILGIAIATCGALLIFIPKFGHFYIGDLFILLATFSAPIGNLYQQKARKIASSETIMFIRNIITIPFLFILSLFIGFSIFSSSIGNSFFWLLLNGVIILGLSKILWIEGIHRVPVTKALAISSLAPFFTIIFSWLFFNQSPNYIQLLSLPLLIIGIFIITDVNFNKLISLNKKELS